MPSGAPAGEREAATASSILGRVKQGSCNRASDRVNQSVFSVTVSPSSRRTITSRLSFIIRRWSAASTPIFLASCTSAPGPTPNITRPRVR